MSGEGRRLRAAVVGLKGIGRAHIKGLKAWPDDCELAAVCDIVPEEAKKCGEEHGVPYYASLEEMFAAQKLDFVTLGTPHPFHLQGAEACAKARVHCLVEKPIASTVADARRIVAVHKKAKTKLGVVFQRRHMAVFQKARELIAAGAIGPIRRALLEYTCTRTDVYYGLSNWRGTWRGEGGGVLLNQAPHFLDLFVWLMDALPAEVTACCDAYLHKIEVEDRVNALLRFADGGSGFIHLSTCEHPGVERIAFYGDKGALVLDGVNLRLARLEPPFEEFIRASDKAFAAPKATWETFPDLSKEDLTHKEVVADFIRACRTPGGVPAVTGADATRSVELANAITYSAFRKRTAKLPLSAPAYTKLLNELIAQAEEKKKIQP